MSSSFGLANVVVSNGSATALTMVSPTFATLLVQPASYATGTLTVSVSAGQFANAVSGANLQSASDAVAFNTTGGPSMVGWAMDWSDEFNGNQLDSTVWNYDTGNGGWGNNELEYYQAQNAVVQNGVLTITAQAQPVAGSPYTSARLQTANKKSFTYGRFQIRAKLPGTQGLWPAFWLLGQSCNSFALYGGTIPWPNCGEIDAMEMIGGAGDYTTHGTLHYVNLTGVGQGPSFQYQNASKLSAGFHTYTVDWTPAGFTWYIDAIPYGTKAMDGNMAAFAQPFFLVLNVAVGGNWPGAPDSTTVLPQTMVIDYVRHYSQSATGP